MSSTLITGVSPLLLFVAKATLVLLAALIGASVLRRGTAGARHLVWLAALVGVLALPLLARIPALHLDVLPASIGMTGVSQPSALPEAIAPAPAQPSPPIASDAARAREGAAAKSNGTTTSASSTASTSFTSSTSWRPSSREPASLLTTLLVAWAGVALSLLAWLVAGAMQVRRIVVRGRELASPDWTTPLCEVADRLDLDAAPRLVLSDDIEMAFACRAMQPTIVLPASAEQWADDRRRAVLFHELAHVKRHDLLGHTLGRVACALYWFHPLVWTAAKHLRAESERACDDLVLGCGAKPSEYAQHLLDMVTSVRRQGAPIMAMPMARRKEFEGRMLAILDPAIRRAAPGRVQAAAVIASLGALSLTIAAVSPAPASPPQTPASVSSSSRTMADTARQDSPPSRPAAQPDQPRSATLAQVPVGPAPHAQPNPVPRPQAEQRPPSFDRVIGKFGTDMAKLTVNGLLGRTQRGLDSSHVSLLISVLQTDSDATVRRSAAWALHDAPTSAARAALVQSLGHDADWRVRETAAWSLSEFESDATANALAEAALHDHDARVRMTATWALAQLDHSGGVDALISASTDADSHVREAAIWGIGQRAVKNAPMSVINALTDQSSAVRTIAAWTLGNIADPAAAAPLARAFGTEPDSHVRVAELWALRSIGDVPTSVLETAMKASDPELRRHGVAMLAGATDPWPWPWPWPWPRPEP